MATNRTVISLNHRLKNLATEEGVPPQRVRNRFVFQRLLARFCTQEAWVLKGGFCLELRLGLAARATKDLDLLLSNPTALTQDEIEDSLLAALSVEAPDPFLFDVRQVRQVRTEDEQPRTWRVRVLALIDGEVFETVSLDVVVGNEPGADEVDHLMVRPTLDGEPFTMASIDLHRHAAEKVHAYARIYAHDRPSSRVKDLIDLALMVERHLLVPVRFAPAVASVFLERDGTVHPAQLPDPPRAWIDPFASMAAEVGLDTSSCSEAADLVKNFYSTAMNRKESR